MNSKDDLDNLRPVQVLLKAIEENRLPHGILLHGENFELLSSIALNLSSKLLATHKNPTTHPDFFSVRPSNKMRQISAETVRNLNKQIQRSPNQGSQKVAVIYEADRMNTTASNAFLKTLEEPPLNTTIFLLSEKPYYLLDTIRSRCFNLKIPSSQNSIQNPEWNRWLNDYAEWIKKSLTLYTKKTTTTELVLSIYALVSRFETLLDDITSSEWKCVKENLPENLSDEEQDALESGVLKKNRNRLFANIEEKTLSVTTTAKPYPPSLKINRVITQLEHLKNLFEVNLNECTALETFFLDSLRVWSS